MIRGKSWVGGAAGPIAGGKGLLPPSLKIRSPVYLARVYGSDVDSCGRISPGSVVSPESTLLYKVGEDALHLPVLPDLGRPSIKRFACRPRDPAPPSHPANGPRDCLHGSGGNPKSQCMTTSYPPRMSSFIPCNPAVSLNLGLTHTYAHTHGKDPGEGLGSGNKLQRDILYRVGA